MEISKESKVKSKPVVIYEEVIEKEPKWRLDMAYNILFEEVMKARKEKKEALKPNENSLIQA